MGSNDNPASSDAVGIPASCQDRETRTIGSALICEARRLSTAERRVLQVSDSQLGFADLCFRAIQLLLDDGDARPKWDRLTDLGARAVELCDSVDWGEIEFAEDMDPKSLGLAWRKLEEHLAIEVDRDGAVILPRWFWRWPVPEFRHSAGVDPAARRAQLPRRVCQMVVGSASQLGSAQTG